MKFTFLLIVISLVTVVSRAQTAEEGAPAGGTALMMEQMQGRMQAMRQQMERIHATDDPEERQRLMREHMESMHQGMQMMGDPTGRQDPVAECEESDTDCRMQQMETHQEAMGRRMGTMRMMMQHMAEQQESAEDE